MSMKGTLALVLAAVAATYASGLTNGFVWLDQREIIEREMILSGPGELLSRLARPALASGYHRPLYELMHSVDLWIWGLRPLGFHLSSLALHLAAVVLAMILMKRLGWDTWAAALLGLFWGLHPVNAEVVGLIHAKADLLCAVLLLASAHLVLHACRAAEQRPGRYVALAVAVFAAALLAKETAFAWPLFAIAVWTYLRRRRPREALLVKTYTVAGSCVAIAALVYRTIDGRFAGALVGWVPLPERLATFAEVYIRYVAMLLWPVGISVSDTVLRASAWPAIHGVVVVMACVAVAGVQALGWARMPSLRPWIALYNLALLPVSQIVPLLHFRSERFLYIPSLAFLGAAVTVVRHVVPDRRSMLPHRAGLALVGAVAVFYAGLDRSRIERFGDDRELFAAEVDANPDYLEGLSVLGSYYDRAGDFARAVSYFRRALAPRLSTISYLPRDGAVLGLSHALLRLNRPGEVVALAEAWLPLMRPSPYVRELRYNAGVAAFSLGRFAYAIDALEPYGREHPADGDCAFLTGTAAARVGNVDLARRELERYLALSPAAADRSYVEGLLRQLPHL